MPPLELLPTIDSPEFAIRRRSELDISRARAAELGETAVTAIEAGTYAGPHGSPVEWSAEVDLAIRSKVSIPPDAALPASAYRRARSTEVQIANETTLSAARRLQDSGSEPLALNFANGVEPGGGFLRGSRAQEEYLCRSSALYATLQGDPMYRAHRERELPDSTDWAILSKRVPVFRADTGDPLDEPWLLDFITCAAPYAPTVGRERSRQLLSKRILRVMVIASAHGYEALILGAWGCGAFGNDPTHTAQAFHDALTGPFDGAFSRVVFAITDWSPERRFLRPFQDVFG